MYLLKSVVGAVDFWRMYAEEQAEMRGRIRKGAMLLMGKKVPACVHCGVCMLAPSSQQQQEEEDRQLGCCR